MAFRWPWAKDEKRSISFQDVWGAGHSAEALAGESMDGALRLVPVFAAVRLIADSIASLPLTGYRQVGDEQRPMATPTVFGDPTMFGGPTEWVQRALVSLLLRGNLFGLVTSVDAAGYPARIEWLSPDDVRVEDDRATSRPRWYYLGRRVEPWLGRDSGGQLLHVPNFTLPGRVLGLSPIGAFRNAIEAGIYAQRHGRDFFRDGAVPSGVLETDQSVGETDAEVIKGRFKQAAKGRDTVVLGSGAKYRPLTVPPEESQFIEAIRANATTIASIYGVPAAMIGGEAGGSLTYETVELNNIALVTHALRPPATKLERALSSLLPRPQHVRFDFDALLRADLKSRYQAAMIGLNAGFLTKAEVREQEGLPPLAEDSESQRPRITGGEGGEVIELPSRAESGD